MKGAIFISLFCLLLVQKPTEAALVKISFLDLLFRNQGQYVFIEKLGTTAPYVRFDFKDKNDLLVWLRAEIEPIMGKEDFLFASFNDREVKEIRH